MDKIFPRGREEEAAEQDPREIGKKLAKSNIKCTMKEYLDKYTAVVLRRGAKFADDLMMKCLLNDINKLMTAVVTGCSKLNLEMSWKKNSSAEIE